MVELPSLTESQVMVRGNNIHHHAAHIIILRQIEAFCYNFQYMIYTMCFVKTSVSWDNFTCDIVAEFYWKSLMYGNIFFLLIGVANIQ